MNKLKEKIYICASALILLYTWIVVIFFKGNVEPIIFALFLWLIWFIWTIPLAIYRIYSLYKKEPFTLFLQLLVFDGFTFFDNRFFREDSVNRFSENLLRYRC